MSNKILLATTLAVLAGCPDEAPSAADLATVPDAGGNPLAARWSVIRAAAPGAPNLFSLFGDGPDRLFAVGSGGTILRAVPEDPPVLDRDGRPRLTFTPMHSGVGADLTAIHGTGPTDIYAVGLGGVILRYDGAAWRTEEPQRAMPGDPAFSADLWGVFAYRDGAIAVGKSGYWTRRVMGKWSVPQRLQVESLQAIWGTAPDNVYAVGSVGYIFRWNGTSWGAASPPGFTNKLAGVFGTGPNNVFAVGLGGSVLRNSGGGFQDYGASVSARCTSPIPKVFLRNGTVAESGEVLLVGWEGVILRLSQGPCGDGGMGLGAYDESGATARRLEGLWAQRDGMRTTIYISGVEGIVLRGEIP